MSSPPPHATAADAARRVDLVERYGLMAAGIGWTRGVLSQAGLLGILTDLPGQLRLDRPDGTRVLGVHASPGADHGPGISPDRADDDLARVLAGCDADVVIGGHTHRATDRLVNGVRALNPGSTGIPQHPGEAGWLLLEFADARERPADLARGTDAGTARGTDAGTRPACGPSSGWCPSTSMPWSAICTPGCTRTRSSSRPCSPAGSRSDASPTTAESGIPGAVGPAA